MRSIAYSNKIAYGVDPMGSCGRSSHYRRGGRRGGRSPLRFPQLTPSVNVAITISVATRHRRGIAALERGAAYSGTGLTPVSFLTIEVSDLRWNTRREGLFADAVCLRRVNAMYFRIHSITLHDKVAL